MNLIDLDQFSSKLRCLIRSKYKKNTEFYKEYNARKNKDIEKVCKQWLKGSNYPKIDTAIDLCDFFNCDLEYLFTDQDTFSRNIDDTAKYIGLEYRTIERLKNLPTEKKHIIDAIVDNTFQSTNLIDLIMQMLYYAHRNSKNKTCILLDEEVTSRSTAFKNLEYELNQVELIDIFSNRLVIEMHELLKLLYQNDNLSNEINQFYTDNYFTQHKNILSVEELPKFSDDGSLDISNSIEQLEKTILHRLRDREEADKHFDYKLDNLSNAADFSKIMTNFRNTQNNDPTKYYLLLQKIDAATK